LRFLDSCFGKQAITGGCRPLVHETFSSRR
jgi:hypothetical protein